jgi:predicted PurR-regulated permease PerM
VRPARPSWDLTRIVLGVAAIGGLVAASFWILRPFLPAVIWATMIVVATWPALRAVQARLWGKRGLAVAVMTLLMLTIIVAPVAVGVATVVENSGTNLLRPLLIRKGADLPLLLIFAGVLGGLLAFGIIGLFIGPVVLAVTYTLLRVWVSEGEARQEGTPPGGTP